MTALLRYMTGSQVKERNISQIKFENKSLIYCRGLRNWMLNRVAHEMNFFVAKE